MEEAIRDTGLTVSQANVLMEIVYGKARSMQSWRAFNL